MKQNKLKLFLVMAALVTALLSFGLIAYADEQVGAMQEVKQSNAYDHNIYLELKGPLTTDTAYYEISVSLDNTNWTIKDKGTSSLSPYISGLNSNTVYYVRVRAYTKTYVSGKGSVYTYGPYSEPIKAITTGDAKIKNLKQSSATTSSITLSWDKVPGVAGYRIYNQYPSDSVAPIATTTTNSVVIKNIKSTTNNSYYVKAYYQCGSFVKNSSDYSSFYSSNVKLKPANIKTRDISIPYYFSSSKKIEVRVNKQEKTTGYQIKAYKYNGKKAVAFIKNGTSSYGEYVANINPYCFYKIQVRGYSVINGKNVYSDKWTTIYTAHQPEVKMKVNSQKNGYNLTWDTVKGATSYTVYASTKQKSGYKKVATVKKTSYKFTKLNRKALKSGKKYYVYVVANRKVGKTTYKSDASYCYYLTLK